MFSPWQGNEVWVAELTSFPPTSAQETRNAPRAETRNTHIKVWFDTSSFYIVTADSNFCTDVSQNALSKCPRPINMSPLSFSRCSCSTSATQNLSRRLRCQQHCVNVGIHTNRSYTSQKALMAVFRAIMLSSLSTSSSSKLSSTNVRTLRSCATKKSHCAVLNFFVTSLVGGPFSRGGRGGGSSKNSIERSGSASKTSMLIGSEMWSTKLNHETYWTKWQKTFNQIAFFCLWKI